MITCNHTLGVMEYRKKTEQVGFLDIGPSLQIATVIRFPQGTSDTIKFNVNDHNHSRFSFELNAADLYSNESITSNLAKHHVIFKYGFENTVRSYLATCYADAISLNMIEYRHTTLGWVKDNSGQDVYLYDSSTINGHLSKFANSDFKFIAGNKEDYFQFVKEVISPHNNLNLAMAIGYSSVVASRLKNHVDIGTIIVNLCGASSTGKTTAEELMVSEFACPIASSAPGLIHTFNATTNATFSSISGFHGLPIVLDDSTTNPYINMPNLVYTIASSTGKARCNSSGELIKDNKDWSGTVIISSEIPIQEQGSSNQGLEARVIHTQGIVWTPDASTADAIKNFVHSNYGHTGIIFAKYVEAQTLDDLLTEYKTSLERVNQLMVKRDNISDRLSLKYAIIDLTITLMQKCFDVKLNTVDLMSVLIQAEQNNVFNRDIGQKAYHVILEFIAEKQTHFDALYRNTGATEPDYYTSKDRYGSIVHKNGIVRVYIPENKVKEQLAKANINEYASVFSRWKNLGYMQTETGHNTVKYSADKKHPFMSRCICLIFNNGLPKYEYPSDYPEQRKCESHAGESAPISNIDYDDTDSFNAIFDDDGQSK